MAINRHGAAYARFGLRERSARTAAEAVSGRRKNGITIITVACMMVFGIDIRMASLRRDWMIE